MENVLTRCRVLTGSKIECLDLYSNGSLFTSIGQSDCDSEVLPGFVLLPMLCNLHVHLGESIFRNITGDDWTLAKYLAYTENINRKMSPRDRQEAWDQSAHFTINELRRNGIGVFCAARSANPCQSYDLCNLSGWPIMDSGKLSSYKTAGISGFKKYLATFTDEKCAVGVFLHSLYANDEDSLRLAAACMEAGAEFLTVHIAEDETSAIAEIARYGQSAIRTLDAYGLLTPRTILVHGGYAEEDDLALVAERGAIIAVCPRSNQFLNTQMPSINLLQLLRIPWCIATDGLATGRTLSLFEQACTFHDQFPDIKWCQLFDAMTNVPARLYSRPIYTGRIEPGTIAEALAVETDAKDAETLLSGLMRGVYHWHYIKC